MNVSRALSSLAFSGFAWAVDIIGLHCFAAVPVWNNITGVGGSPAAWTSRGRW